MPTTGVVNSTLFKLRTGGTPTVVGDLLDVTLSVNHETRDVTTKDSAGWRELLEGLRSYSLNCSGLLAFDTTNAGTDMIDSVTNRTLIEWEFGTGVTGDPKYSGEGYVSTLEAGSPGREDNATYSFTIEGTGAYTVGTYA
jgi:predicted secreted protein